MTSQEIKTFFEKKGYVVEDKMKSFTDNDIYVGNELDPQNYDDYPVYLKKVCIYEINTEWIVFQPKFGGNNKTDKFETAEQACLFTLNFLGPPKYE